MMIESRTIVGGAAAFALVGAVLWASAVLLNPPQEERATVEVTSMEEKAWKVEVQDLAPAEQRTAATAR